MDTAGHLLKISNVETRLYDIGNAVGLELDLANEAPDNHKYATQLSTANELYDCVRNAEKLANHLWKSLNPQCEKPNL